MISQVFLRCSAVQAQQLLHSRIFTQRKEIKESRNAYGPYYQAVTATGRHTVTLMAESDGRYYFSAVAQLPKRVLYCSEFLTFVLLELGRMGFHPYVEFHYWRRLGYLVYDTLKFSGLMRSYTEAVLCHCDKDLAEVLYNQLVACTALPYLAAQAIRAQLMC